MVVVCSVFFSMSFVFCRFCSSVPCQTEPFSSRPTVHPKQNRYKLCAETLIWHTGIGLAETGRPGGTAVVGVFIGADHKSFSK